MYGCMHSLIYTHSQRKYSKTRRRIETRLPDAEWVYFKIKTNREKHHKSNTVRWGKPKHWINFLKLLNHDNIHIYLIFKKIIVRTKQERAAPLTHSFDNFKNIQFPFSVLVITSNKANQANTCMSSLFTSVKNLLIVKSVFHW